MEIQYLILLLPDIDDPPAGSVNPAVLLYLGPVGAHGFRIWLRSGAMELYIALSNPGFISSRIVDFGVVGVEINPESDGLPRGVESGPIVDVGYVVQLGCGLVEHVEPQQHLDVTGSQRLGRSDRYRDQ